jgi:hypothetical protein
VDPVAGCAAGGGVAMIVRRKVEASEFEPVRFEAGDMEAVGSVASAAMQERIGRGVTVTDALARPLSAGYAKAKARRGLPAIRDYRFTGEFLAGLGVTGASAGSVTIAPSVVAPGKAAALERANARDGMVGLSPADQERVAEELAARYAEKNLRRGGTR